MKPETVLNLKPGDSPEKIRDEWLGEYKSYADEFTDTEETAALLSARVKRAYELISERCAAEPATSHDETFYEEVNRRMTAEDAELDGDFPLGNEEDAAFAGAYFPIADLVSIQLGYRNLVDCGYYTEYNYAVLIRKGFIAEMSGEWLEAARCYEGVSGSMAVQKREYACRRKAKEKGEQLYAEAQGYMERGQWSEVFWPLQCAADMGSTDAMTDLGLARIYGQYGCTKDSDEALKLLRSAAKSGNARAAFEICELYDSGMDIDAQEAMNMCEVAAQSGNKKAIARLNDGFDLRPKSAIYIEQAEKGNADAMWLAYRELKDTDAAEAAKWLDRALEAGQTDALLCAAEFCSDKTLECYDEKSADEYLRRAAENGSVKAVLALGDRELSDGDTSFWEAQKDSCGAERHKRQMAWYRMAAESGYVPAMVYLSRAYRNGYPDGINEKEAFSRAASAAASGNAEAMYLVGTDYERDGNYENAVDYYSKAAEKGIVPAMLRLYEIFREGKGNIKKDEEAAAKYLFMSGAGRD